MTGRIVFPGNPWPAGHDIIGLAWSGRLEPATGLWFDLDLATADYYAGDPDDEDENDDEDDDWTAKIVWSNYHACTLSSSAWDEQRGFRVATVEAPLSLNTLAGREFLVDWDPEHPDAAATADAGDEDELAAFGIYLLGHDSVAYHRIRFPERRGDTAFSLDWSGRIALTYQDLDAPYDHEFHAVADPVTFNGIDLPDTLEDQQARALLARLLVEADDFRLLKERHGRTFRHRTVA